MLCAWTLALPLPTLLRSHLHRTAPALVAALVAQVGTPLPALPPPSTSSSSAATTGLDGHSGGGGAAVVRHLACATTRLPQALVLCEQTSQLRSQPLQPYSQSDAMNDELRAPAECWRRRWQRLLAGNQVHSKRKS